MVFVAKPSGRDHYDPGEDIRGSNEALSGAGVELELLVEDDWEEVGERVADRCRAPKT